VYDAFFRYARERQTIFLKKMAGAPREEWTSDPILSHFKFCNVFREDDRTTIWLRENVRQRLPLRELLLATIVFRWFNRMSTGEAIFFQRDFFGDGRTAWEHFLERRNVEPLKYAILEHCGKGPYVTGAYCIIGLPNMPKIDGILGCIQNVVDGHSSAVNPRTQQDLFPGLPYVGWEDLTKYLMDHRGKVPLEAVWEWFRRFPRSGDFIAYEVVTDLNHTSLLDWAPDNMVWANAGPGAIRGLNRIRGRALEQKVPKETSNYEMWEILEISRYPDFWPSDWSAWDMRTVEHTLCEFDKYERLRLGEGHVKAIYR
jgi:hypothetical protein